MHWQTSRYTLDLSTPKVMGIVNVTPDSFSDGGQHASHRAAMAHCEQLLKDGADILDIGGESTRPGAAPVEIAEEIARTAPLIAALRARARSGRRHPQRCMGAALAKPRQPTDRARRGEGAPALRRLPDAHAP